MTAWSKDMIATLHRNGTTYGTANKRYFDVCRSVAKIPPSKAREMTAGNREGSVNYEANVQPINPSQRYCANLGHIEDDESDLIYMRARYYEPWSGRFISEDPDKNGVNWYAYASNCPNTLVDSTGNDDDDEYLAPTDTIVRWLNQMLSGLDPAIAGGVIGVLVSKTTNLLAAKWRDVAAGYLRQAAERLLYQAQLDFTEAASAAALSQGSPPGSVVRAAAAARASHYGRRAIANTVAGWTLKILAFFVELLL